MTWQEAFSNDAQFVFMMNNALIRQVGNKGFVVTPKGMDVMAQFFVARNDSVVLPAGGGAAMIQISEAEYERMKKLAGISHCELPASPKLGPIRPVSDPSLELTRGYVERMGCRHAHSIGELVKACVAA